MINLTPLPLLLIGLLLTGCVTKAPDAETRRETSFPIPETYEAAVAASRDQATPLADSLLALFGDPVLSNQVQQALNQNPGLLLTQARIAEAHYLAEQSGGGKKPTLSASGGAARLKFLPNTSSANRFKLGLDASWEVDVWGRIGAFETAADYNVEALRADLSAARESVAAQFMQAWFDRITQQQLLDLTERRIASFERTEDLIQERFEFGTGDLGDLDSAKTDTELAKADLPRQTEAVAKAERGMRGLIGGYPNAGAMQAGEGTPILPELESEIAAGLPSSLLLNRPDIRAAYQRILAADQRVVVASADRVPGLVLTGSLGQQSEALKNLIKSGFDVWSIASQLSAPIFDAGRLEMAERAAEARVAQAIHQYDGTVLGAFEEVENALGSEEALKQEQAQVILALEAARKAEEKIRGDYENGLSDILLLLDIQRRIFTTEERLINLQNNRLKNRIGLGLALGLGV